MPDKDTQDEKLLILPLGEESKKLTQVISNDTARQIIELLADAPLSASDISVRLHVPLTTIIYNLENLESVGLARVERIKYSEKGREVKIYAPVRKLIVVVPEKIDRKSIAEMIKKYLGIILAATMASGLIEFFTRYYEREAMISENQKSLTTNPAVSSTPGPSQVIAPDIMENGGSGNDLAKGIFDFLISHPGIMFLLGCFFVILLFIVMDWRIKKKNM